MDKLRGILGPWGPKQIVWTVALSALLIPGLIYICGRLFAGPYEGDFGILGLYMVFFRDLASLRGAAWFLLLSPLLFFLAWQLALQSRKLANRGEPGTAD